MTHFWLGNIVTISVCITILGRLKQLIQGSFVTKMFVLMYMPGSDPEPKHVLKGTRKFTHVLKYMYSYITLQHCKVHV